MSDLTKPTVLTSETTTEQDRTALLNGRFDRIRRLLEAGAKPGYDYTFHLLDVIIAGMWVLDPLVPWMTIDIGGIPANDHIAQLEADGFFVGDWAKDIMGRPDYKPGEPRSIVLSRCRVRDLGFTANPTTTDLFARVELVGGLCPPEVGPHLRKALAEQPVGDYFWVAMTPIVVLGALPGVFLVRRGGDGERWLGGGFADPDGRWDLDVEIVLVLNK